MLANIELPAKVISDPDDGNDSEESVTHLSETQQVRREFALTAVLVPPNLSYY